jgi:hypothetical protein
MGKTRKSRKGYKPRDDPVGLDSAIEELENGMDREFGQLGSGSIVQNIMDQLQSGTEVVTLVRIWRSYFQ